MDHMKRIFSGILAICFLIVFPIACSDDEDPGIAPELPPVGSMVMDFSVLEDGNSAGRLETQVNWGVAAVHVAVWNTILTINVALPVASFTTAISQTPSYDFDRNLWVWTYDYTFLGRTYTSELTAILTTSKILWEMQISQENGFQDVTWYTGETALDGNSGFWLLNYNADDPEPRLRIDWVRTGEEISLITYTNVNEGDDNEGGYIEYGNKISGEFDAYYEISMPTRDSDVLIEWRKENGSGHIQDPEFFQDEEWHCWDENFEDIDC